MSKLVPLIFLMVLTMPAFLRALPSKPVSVSYENLLRCFPELKNDKISFKVDLNLLKEVIDEKFATSRSQLRQRRVQFLDPDKKLMNLILRTKAGVKLETELTLQQVDEKGVVTDVKIPAAQRYNPKQEVVNNFLLGATIKSDEYAFNDTKLNNTFSSYVRNFKEVQEITLRDYASTRVVLCEKKSDLGIICTCTKK